MKNNKRKEEECPHCGGSFKIRNPKGYCDHLYYPENCRTCSLLDTSQEHAEGEK